MEVRIVFTNRVEIGIDSVSLYLDKQEIDDLLARYPPTTSYSFSFPLITSSA